MQTEQFTCKTCGANLDISAAVNGVIECPYCRNVWTLAKKETSPAALSYLRIGEHDLDTCKFDDAFLSYKKAAEAEPDEPEAYFGMALATFKVQYLKDEIDNCLRPVCHEITDKRFSENRDYIRARAMATPAQRAEYEKRAREIDYIQSEFYKLKLSGVDYDCFICVKVTDDKTGLKTSDYKSADDIYFALKGKGYKPFFSERELSNVTGADYEARILYALYSSECMLVVCRNEEYLQTPWVKNEYSRFLKLVNDDEKETDSIAIAFADRPIEKLPGRNGKLQGIDLRKLDALYEVENFVETHTPEARAKRVAEAEAKKNAAEEQKKALNEQRRALEEQQRQIAEQLEKLKNVSSAPSAELSDDELFERMERAREEHERKKREEDKRIAREKAEEKARIAREKAEEERKRREEMNARPLTANRTTLSNYNKTKFKIEGTELKKYIANAGTVKIPFGVTSIGYQAFMGYPRQKMKRVTIPDSVNSIEKDAFYNCQKLAKINIPDSVIYIGDSAFMRCEKLKNINIPNSVTAIGALAFCYCTSLTSITIPDSLTFIAGNAFGSCTNLKSVIIPDSVTSIGMNAFESCENLRNVIIPDSVTSIGVCAFINCTRLRKIIIPESVTYIGQRAFENCARKIYCRAECKPEGWEENWTLPKTKVVWGYKGK